MDKNKYEGQSIDDFKQVGESGNLPTFEGLPDDGPKQVNRLEKQDLNLERIQREINGTIKEIEKIDKNLEKIENAIKNGRLSIKEMKEIKAKKEMLQKQKDMLTSEVTELRERTKK